MTLTEGFGLIGKIDLIADDQRIVEVKAAKAITRNYIM